jgi:small-conductance mechanosensitive channel
MFNAEHVLVPNDRITDDEIVNYSKTDRLRLTTEVGVDYDEDVEEAAVTAKAAMADCDSVAAAPSPDVVLDSFADSAIVLELRYWIDRPAIQRKLSARNEVIDAVKRAFEAEGIKIPYPQRELTGREETDGLRLSSELSEESLEDVEPAVRRARNDSTDVEEPVQERYGGDGGAENGESADEGPADDPDDEGGR